jgi:hypothetical protein
MMMDITAATTMVTMGKVIRVVHIMSLHPITIMIMGARVIMIVAILVVIMEHLPQPVAVEHLPQPVAVEHLPQPANYI